MNALTTPDTAAEASGAPLLSLLAVQNMDVLQALHDLKPVDTKIADFAAQLGKDVENLRKSLKKLCAEGYADWAESRPLPVITKAGVLTVEAWARAHGAPAPRLGEDGVPIDLIDPWPDQPRQHKPPEVIEEIAQSIVDNGILQALVLRPSPVHEGRYQVVIGETRRAAVVLGIERGWHPAGFVVPAEVRQLSDAEAYKLALAENVHRNDLHWADEAQAFRKMQEVYGYSASEISRMYEGKRGKRSIQDFIKIAREMDPAVLKDAYLPEKLPDGTPNKARLTYVQARELVGEKKEKPALDLKGSQAMTFLELLDAALLRLGRRGQPKAGEKLLAQLHAAPTTKAITALQYDKGLIGFDFHDFKDGRGRNPTVVIKVTDDVLRWLSQVGYLGDGNTPLIGLRLVRAGAMGDMLAAGMPADRWFTAELNAPATPTPQGEASTPQAETEGASATDDAAYLTSADLGMEPTPIPHPQLRVLVEIAHVVAHEAGEPKFDRAIQVGEDAVRDPAVQALERDRRLIVQRLSGRTLVYLDFQGERLLRERGLVPTGDTDCPALAKVYEVDELGSAQSWLEDRGVYASSWLNTPSPSAEGDVDEIPGYLRRLAGPGTPPAPVAASEAQAAPDLPPMLAIVMIEVAYKVAHDPTETVDNPRTAAMSYGWHRDERLMKLIQQHGYLKTVSGGNGMLSLCKLTPKGLDWLLTVDGIAVDGDRPRISLQTLLHHQVRLLGERSSGSFYATPWLNAEAEAQTDLVGAPPASDAGDERQPCEGDTSPASDDVVEEASSDPLAKATEDLAHAVRALAQMDAAARQLIDYVGRLPGRPKPPPRAEADRACEILERALLAAKPLLPASQPEKADTP